MIWVKRKMGLDFLLIENEFLRVEVVPILGGKITSVFNKVLQKEFLWHDKQLALQENPAGADYDSNFWGGIDELMPNDIPEQIDDIEYPDHGELWTTGLNYEVKDDRIVLFGLLKLSNLSYRKEISLNSSSPRIVLTYHIQNEATTVRHFLWKMHAALQIAPGDYLKSTALKGRVVYPASSRFEDTEEFLWPTIEGKDAALIPPKNGTMDFFYLYPTQIGTMSLLMDNGKYRFGYEYDRMIFPYEWYFASYGQFRDHYVAILEPATAMPVSVREAIELKQCTVLGPGEVIDTTVNIYAGLNQ